MAVPEEENIADEARLAAVPRDALTRAGYDRRGQGVGQRAAAPHHIDLKSGKYRKRQILDVPKAHV